MKSLAARDEPGVPQPNYNNYHDPRNAEWVDLPDLVHVNDMDRYCTQAVRKERLKSK